MKITIEVSDIELFAKAFNNAIAACGHIYWTVCMGCQIPSDFEKLGEIPEEELVARHKCLRDVYEQIEQIEDAYKAKF